MSCIRFLSPSSASRGDDHHHHQCRLSHPTHLYAQSWSIPDPTQPHPFMVNLVGQRACSVHLHEAWWAFPHFSRPTPCFGSRLYRKLSLSVPTLLAARRGASFQTITFENFQTNCSSVAWHQAWAFYNMKKPVRKSTIIKCLVRWFLNPLTPKVFHNWN